MRDDDHRDQNGDLDNKMMTITRMKRLPPGKRGEEEEEEERRSPPGEDQYK